MFQYNNRLIKAYNQENQLMQQISVWDVPGVPKKGVLKHIGYHSKTV